jgi:hypothetical protein
MLKALPQSALGLAKTYKLNNNIKLKSFPKNKEKRKMQIKNIKTAKISTTIIITILFASMMVLALPAKAQTNLPAGVTPTNVKDGTSATLPSGVTPDLSIDTTPYLSFRPNPVGVNQPILVNMWITPALHVSRYIVGYQVIITKPDGTTETKTLNSYRADTTAWFEYTPDQVGTYKLKFINPGAYYSPGNYTINAGAFVSQTANAYTNFLLSCYYKPSETKEQTLTVQQDMVYSWQPVPLPTDYWTRPVHPNNREWAPILGNFPWYGPGGGANWPTGTNVYTATGYKWTPYVQAPNTAHIAWKRQGAIGGMFGGELGDWSSSSGGGTPSIIYQGRAYQTWTKANPSATGSLTYLQCYDIRTGQLYFERPMFTGEATPSAIEYDPGHPEVPGAGDSPLGLAQSLIGFSSGRMYKYNLWTGAMSANYSIAPLTTATYEMNGYAFGIQTIGSSYYLINFTTYNQYQSTTALSPSAIMSNITWPWNTIGQYDLESGYTGTISAITPSAEGAYYGSWIRGANLKTGALTFNITDPDTLYSGSCQVSDHGKIAGLMMAGYYKTWDLATGKLAWTGERMDYPWSAPGFGAYSIQSAYGLVYREAYDGVYAWDWNTGKIVWHFIAPAAAPYETPYTDINGSTVYSFNAGGILADGKIFVYNTEHTASQPITRGWRMYCVNATTGVGLWNITGVMSPGAIADGYLAASNGYDGYMYVFGKGQSATTISAPQVSIAQGQSFVLSGSVLDKSPGQPNTPCASKESMTQWMEYLHMQAPVPTNFVGVPVSIDAVDPNGNVIHIATVTSDMSGTYSFVWTPDIAGKYTVTASFIGDESYGSSWAETAVSIVNAPTTTIAPTPTPIANTPYELYTLGTGAAIIIAIAAAVLLLKKRA